MSLRLKEIKDFNSLEFKKSLIIYQSSFPPNETRPIEKVVEMLKDDKNYHLLIALNNDSVLGISLLYMFKNLKLGFLDYMAVSPNHQRKGIGTELFKYTIKKCYSELSDVNGLLLEVQKENISDLKESRKRKDRIRLYTRLGVKLLNGVNYLLPSQNDGNLEEMYLMIKPLAAINSLSKLTVFQYVDALYSKIYQYENSNDLLTKVFKNIPTTVNICDLVI
jgi:ribosomal protein S18 acetylase RimI-like enzyme